MPRSDAAALHKAAGSAQAGAWLESKLLEMGGVWPTGRVVPVGPVRAFDPANRFVRLLGGGFQFQTGAGRPAQKVVGIPGGDADAICCATSMPTDRHIDKLELFFLIADHASQPLAICNGIMPQNETIVATRNAVHAP